MPKRAREYDLDWLRPMTRRRTGRQLVDRIVQLPLDLVERILAFVRVRQWQPLVIQLPRVESARVLKFVTP